MKMRVSFEINVPPQTKVVDAHLRANAYTGLWLIIADALSNFVSNRSPAEDYVEKHYQWMTPKGRKHKTAQVKDRVDLVRYIQDCGLNNFQVTKIECPNASMYDPDKCDCISGKCIGDK